MRDAPVYQEHSADGSFRFEVCRDRGCYVVWVQRKITDEYIGPEWLGYCDISDVMHRADTLERALEIGRECLRCLG